MENYSKDKYAVPEDILDSFIKKGSKTSYIDYINYFKYRLSNDVYNNLLELSELMVEKNKKDTKLIWAKRLSKLAEISIEDAIIIADEKIEYKNDKISEMIDRDCANPSRRRGKLIEKMERENPLRYIKDKEHAIAILSASKRHNTTNYDNMLDEARYLANIGEINKSDVKDYARQKYTK